MVSYKTIRKIQSQTHFVILEFGDKLIERNSRLVDSEFMVWWEFVSANASSVF